MYNVATLSVDVIVGVATLELVFSMLRPCSDVTTENMCDISLKWCHDTKYVVAASLLLRL